MQKKVFRIHPVINWTVITCILASDLISVFQVFRLLPVLPKLVPASPLPEYDRHSDTCSPSGLTHPICQTLPAQTDKLSIWHLSFLDFMNIAHVYGLILVRFV